ncbi:hypothetical protein TWF730_010534 [Orbilia blumenaviensis]|uniref:F-box domain-containing protein n=1 Tax=Orbilia blumenaviensis TaxID=1796055 RepID=A0AAV9USZ8_9PEZI
MQFTIEPMASSVIEVLPSEILGDIVGYLDRHEQCLLLRVCQRFYCVAHPLLWNSLEFDPYIGPSQLRRPNRDRAASLVKAVKSTGADAMGFHYIRELSFGPAQFDEHSVWVQSGLLKIICDLLAAGKINIRRVLLYWHEFRSADEINCPNASIPLKFLKLLKEYAEMSPPPKLQIIARRWYNCRTKFPTQLFPLEFTTYLDIAFRTKDYSGRCKDATINCIKQLTAILERASSLELLKLETIEDYNDSPGPIEGLPLEQLQNSITNLRSLRELEIRRLLFHPSFFVTPPENVKKLTLWHYVSVAWWKHFTRCPFTKVKELRLRTEHALKAYSDGRTDYFSENDVESKSLAGGAYSLILGRLELKSLKLFELYKWECYFPQDLLELVIQNNPGLGKEQIERLLASPDNKGPICPESVHIQFI